MTILMWLMFKVTGTFFLSSFFRGHLTGKSENAHFLISNHRPVTNHQLPQPSSAPSSTLFLTARSISCLETCRSSSSQRWLSLRMLTRAPLTTRRATTAAPKATGLLLVQSRQERLLRKPLPFLLLNSACLALMLPIFFCLF